MNGGSSGGGISFGSIYGSLSAGTSMIYLNMMIRTDNGGLLPSVDRN